MNPNAEDDEWTALHNSRIRDRAHVPTMRELDKLARRIGLTCTAVARPTGVVLTTPVGSPRAEIRCGARSKRLMRNLLKDMGAKDE